MSASTQRPVLPNSPLSEVTAEVRFHGSLSLFQAWGRIQSDLRGRFPNLLVPGVVVGTSPLLQHVQLANASSSRALLLSINSAAYQCHQYPGWDEFRRELVEIFGVFFKHAGDLRFSRLGLRYVNVLPPVFSGDQLSRPGYLHPALKVRLAGPESLRLFHEPPSLQAVVAGDDGVLLRVHLQPGPLAPSSLGPGGEIQMQAQGGLLDFDAYRTDGLTADGLMPFFESAHGQIEAAFFDLVTADYLKCMES